MSVRVVLLGGTDLTIAVANSISDHLVGVLTVPAELKISYSPGGLRPTRAADVAGWAASRGIRWAEWQGAAQSADFLSSLGADWALAVGWYFLLPATMINLFPFGCGGIHASLLPRYRGNAPLNWAIINGDTEAGVSLFRLTAGTDEGPLYGQEVIPITPRTTITELVAATDAATMRLVSRAIQDLDSGRVETTAQVGDVSYTLARVPDDGRINWASPARAIDRLVRASTRPYPGAFTLLDGAPVRVWSGEAVDVPRVFGACGQLWHHNAGMFVVTGEALFRIDEATSLDGVDARPFLRKSSRRRFDT
ncbi:MAG: methionyl-tRNA formyltransferase [Actinomycetota bacterium]|jgi:methionyl-tRNA formyltransferase|nr:methionyl-tRNA formyltransferase [Actinomycetota bacterium]